MMIQTANCNSVQRIELVRSAVSSDPAQQIDLAGSAQRIRDPIIVTSMADIPCSGRCQAPT
jgi:hypothetical protein